MTKVKCLLNIAWLKTNIKKERKERENMGCCNAMAQSKLGLSKETHPGSILSSHYTINFILNIYYEKQYFPNSSFTIFKMKIIILFIWGIIFSNKNS